MELATGFERFLYHHVGRLRILNERQSPWSHAESMAEDFTKKKKQQKNKKQKKTKITTPPPTHTPLILISH